MPDLSDLINLMILDISSTRISRLGPDVAKLAHLTHLYLVPPCKRTSKPFARHQPEQFNQFTFPPPEILAQGLEKIVHFLLTNNQHHANHQHHQQNQQNQNANSEIKNIQPETILFRALLNEMCRDSNNAEMYRQAVFALLDSFRQDIIPCFFVVESNLDILTCRMEHVEQLLEKMDSLKLQFLVQVILFIQNTIFNAMLMYPVILTAQNTAIFMKRVERWKLFVWESFSIVTMDLITELLNVRAALSRLGHPGLIKIEFLNTFKLNNTSQLCKWIENCHQASGKPLPEFDFKTDSQNLFLPTNQIIT